MKRIQEVFLDIKEYKGVYQVSNLGRVKRLIRKVNNHPNNKSIRILPEIILSQKTKHKGYKEVNLLGRSRYVHRLVTEAFIGDVSNKQVNHKDLNKSNNKVGNLEIVTASQNQKHSYKNGVNKPPVMVGTEHPLAKLNNEIVIKIRNTHKLDRSIKNLCRLFPKIPRSTLIKVVYKQTWKHI